jgi:hypothetical protein
MLFSLEQYVLDEDAFLFGAVRFVVFITLRFFGISAAVALFLAAFNVDALF